MPTLARPSARSWMIQANAVSYGLLLIVILAGWLWPRLFQALSAAMLPVSMWIVTLALLVASLFQGR